MSEHRHRPPRGQVISAGAIAVAIAASGCGQSIGPGAERDSSATSAHVAHDRGTVPRSRQLREYRRMIVALYRVPGAAALNRRGGDPFDQLWRSLATMYGPVLEPRRVSAETLRAPDCGAGAVSVR